MYTYVIINSKSELYVGITTDYIRQLKDHNKGRIAATKSSTGDWKELHLWAIDGYIPASKLKRYLNTLGSGVKLNIIKRYPIFCKELADKFANLPTTAYERKQGEIPT